MTTAKTIKVYDHGFVTLLNIAGPSRRALRSVPSVPLDVRDFDADDIDPANAARMSFGQANSGRTLAQDMQLAAYLMKNWHTSPFEQVQVWFEVKLPIFVARQFVRHRTARLNEVSARYVMLPSEWYIPEAVGGKAVDKKQGQTDNLDQVTQDWFKSALRTHCERGFELYTRAVIEGVAPEHARIALGLGHYTHWLWNQDLHNLMHFLSLRLHAHAQMEARQYAQAKYDLLAAHLPLTMNLFDQYRRRP